MSFRDFSHPCFFPSFSFQSLLLSFHFSPLISFSFLPFLSFLPFPPFLPSFLVFFFLTFPSFLPVCSSSTLSLVFFLSPFLLPFSHIYPLSRFSFFLSSFLSFIFSFLSLLLSFHSTLLSPHWYFFIYHFSCPSTFSLSSPFLSSGHPFSPLFPFFSSFLLPFPSFLSSHFYPLLSFPVLSSPSLFIPFSPLFFPLLTSFLFFSLFTFISFPFFAFSSPLLLSSHLFVFCLSSSIPCSSLLISFPTFFLLLSFFYPLSPFSFFPTFPTYLPYLCSHILLFLTSFLFSILLAFLFLPSLFLLSSLSLQDSTLLPDVSGSFGHQY